MIHDTHCDSEIKGQAKNRGSTIVLNSQRWNGIVNHLHRGEKEHILDEQARQYKEYLFRESKAMTRKWENSLEKTRELKNLEKAKIEKEKVLEGERRFKELKASDEKKRMELNAKAEDAMQRLKIGARQLDSAYMLSDVLNTRATQCQMNEEALKNKKEKYMAEGREKLLQAEQWTEAHRQKILEKRRHTDEYKTRLKEHIIEEQQRRENENKQIAESERKYRAQQDSDLKEQMERERNVLLRKKENLRRNALEAMKMAEERKARNNKINEIEDKVAAVFKTDHGNPIIEEVTKKRKQFVEEEKERLRVSIVDKIQKDINDKLAAEAIFLSNAKLSIEMKLDQKELAKIEHAKRQKAGRIQLHIEEMEEEKRLKKQQEEELQWDIANRLKNEEVNVAYDQQKRMNITQKTLDNRKTILKQIAVNEIRDAKRCEALRYAEEINEKDDREFFKYANELVEEAKSKKRPILPLIKTIKEYKSHNNLYGQKEDLPHLKTNISIGLASPKCSNRSLKYNAAELKQFKPSDTCSIASQISFKNLPQQILQKCNRGTIDEELKTN